MKKNELHKIAPKLSEISPVFSGFKIPDNYFDTIEDAVLGEITLAKFKSLKNKKEFKTPPNYFKSVEDIIVTKLKSEVIQHKNNKEIPKDYFISFENTILNKLNRNSKIVSKRKKIIKIITPLAIAASLLLIFVLKTNSSTISFNTVTTTEIETWINEGYIDINEFNIASIYDEIEIETDFNSLLLTDDEVLDYLYDENIDDTIFEN